MDIKTVLQLLSSVEDTGWKVFELKEDTFSFRLERDDPNGIVPVIPEDGESGRLWEKAEERQDSVLQDRAMSEAGAARNIGEVKSPLVGVFKELEGDRAVKNGMFVEKGQPVCIIEAMKLMNEITMPEDGTIIWQVANNGDAVEYGQLLFQYTPAQG